MAIAPYCINKKKISVIWGIILFICYFVFYLLHVRQYAIWAIIPVIIYLSVLLVKFLSKIPKINEFINLMGNISLESYLTNIYLNSLFIFFNSRLFLFADFLWEICRICHRDSIRHCNGIYIQSLFSKIF